jgi:uncharacterized protein YjbI with pentapeptide repeats
MNIINREGTAMTWNSFFPIFSLAIALLSLLCSPCYAFRNADLDKLLKTKKCQWCDLQNADLSGTHLAGADLSGSNLSGATLSRANLSDANLSSCYLRNANLSKANLSNAYFRNANLTGADMSGADLSHTDLSGATWIDGDKCDKGSFGECKVRNLMGRYD